MKIFFTKTVFDTTNYVIIETKTVLEKKKDSSGTNI